MNGTCSSGEEKDTPKTIDDYISFLFRSQDTNLYLAGAYMTGILPIIKYNTHSALSDFKERTMFKPVMLAENVGFTNEDVHKVCQKFRADEQLMKIWYDGYKLPGVGDVYCPSSVMEAAVNDDYASHWTATASLEALTNYIFANLDGLIAAMNELLDGKDVVVDAKDKVLTVLVYLGYLAYDNYTSTVRIPNLEVRLQMLEAFAKSTNEEYFKRIDRCKRILKAAKDHRSTITMNKHCATSCCPASNTRPRHGTNPSRSFPAEGDSWTSFSCHKGKPAKYQC